MSPTTTCTLHNPVNATGGVPQIQGGRIEPWNFNTIVCNSSSTPNQIFSPTTTISTTTHVQVYGYMSSGEILIATFILLLIFLKLFEMLAAALGKVNTKRYYIGYQAGDVPIKEDV